MEIPSQVRHFPANCYAFKLKPGRLGVIYSPSQEFVGDAAFPIFMALCLERMLQIFLIDIRVIFPAKELFSESSSSLECLEKSK